MRDSIDDPLIFTTAGEASMDVFLSVTADSPNQDKLSAYVEDLIARRCTRLNWCVVGTSGGAAVNRAAFWSMPDRTVPTDLVLIDGDWSEDGGASARALLGHMHERARGLGADQLTHHVDEPVGPPQYQDHAAARIRLLETCGYELLRDGLRWLFTSSSRRAEASRPEALSFRTLPEVGEEAFLKAFAATYEGTRDSWLRREIEERGLNEAARAGFDDYKGFGYLPEWWELAYTEEGALAGVIMPARNPTSAVIGHVGVVPEQRGRGFAAQLVRRGTDVLVAAGADEIRGDCDTDNVPMVKAFERAGYARIARRRSYGHRP
jgi:ribosomal protein S18 acetylase RimI-like enzyme